MSKEFMKKLLQTIWLILCGILRNGYQKTLKRKEANNG